LLKIVSSLSSVLLGLLEMVLERGAKLVIRSQALATWAALSRAGFSGVIDIPQAAL
jgi:hypothetical protein